MGGVRGVNNERVRRRNLSAVLTHVHRAGSTTRSSLASATGLNRSTIGVLVGELAERGLVTEGEAVGRGTPGRPSPTVEPSSEAVAVLAASIGVGTMSIGLAGLGGAIERRVAVDRSTSRQTPEATADDLAELAAAITAELPGGRRVVGMGVAVPGVVREQDGFVAVAANLDWEDVPFIPLLAERLPAIPSVQIANDADLGALAEHVRGAGVGFDDLIYLEGGIGIGGGIISGGRPLRGVAGYAGEVGHLVVVPDGRPCGCGGRGCLETEAGYGALLRRLGREAEPERVGLATLLDEAADGDEQIRAALAEVGTWVGRGVASLVNVLNPGRVILGGFLAEAEAYVGEPLRAALDLHGQRPNRSEVTVLTAALGGDSALIGAAELALRPLLADPLGTAA